jgi:uncharacterized protein YjeT (DUF2065 family)
VKRLISFCFLAVLVCLIPGSRPAQARSFVSVLASVPDSIFHAVTIGTDTAEYVSSKVAYGFAEIDTYADAGVTFFHDLAHPNTVTAQAKLAKKQAKAAAKAAKAQKK